LDKNAWQCYSKLFNRPTPNKDNFWKSINLLDFEYKRGLLKPLGLITL
jgi:hypothetical protein